MIRSYGPFGGGMDTDLYSKNSSGPREQHDLHDAGLGTGAMKRAKKMATDRRIGEMTTRLRPQLGLENREDGARGRRT